MPVDRQPKSSRPARDRCRSDRWGPEENASCPPCSGDEEPRHRLVTGSNNGTRKKRPSQRPPRRHILRHAHPAPAASLPKQVQSQQHQELEVHRHHWNHCLRGSRGAAPRPCLTVPPDMADGGSAPVMPRVQQGCTCGCPSAKMDHAVVTRLDPPGAMQEEQDHGKHHDLTTLKPGPDHLPDNCRGLVHERYRPKNPSDGARVDLRSLSGA